MTDLFSPGRIAPLAVASRIVMASMTTRNADAEGLVTDATVAYFGARAGAAIQLGHGGGHPRRHLRRDAGRAVGGTLRALLQADAGRWPLFRGLLSHPRLRGWLYRRARRATGPALQARLGTHRTVTVIGDAAAPGKTREAVTSAFEAALLARAKQRDCATSG